MSQIFAPRVFPEPIAPEPRSVVVEAFRETVYSAYREHGRSFAWRETSDPYHILVSEIMLQQTQVERVAKKYPEFLAVFPSFEVLANAPLGQVLAAWQGMGYNRRAIALKRSAETVVREYGGRLPSSVDSLEKFPGIGAATAGSICAFAFNMPTVFIETNIRRVFIHSFFAGEEGVSDRQILPLVAETLDAADPRTWYYALTDYGVLLRRLVSNPNRRSQHYHRQSQFEGSRRQVRAKIVRLLLREGIVSREAILAGVGETTYEVGDILDELLAEGMLARERDSFRLPE
jgi:A/G-specific adenine glycosylase